MDRFFMLAAVIGTIYLAILVFVSSTEQQERYMLRLRHRWEGLGERLDQGKLAQLLDDSGLMISARKVTLLRYSAALLYVLVQSLGSYIRGVPLSWWDLLIGALILVLTSPARLLPLGWMLAWLHRRSVIRKDGELISFLRLYENNRLRKRGYSQFGIFCAEAAGHFVHIRHDLYELSERAVDEGSERSIVWFCGRFPEGHPFIGDIRAILLATEGMDDDLEAASYLKEQGSIIAQISSDQYLRKWSIIGDVATVINVIPSITTFLMIVTLAMQYIMLIKGNFNEIRLFQ